MRMRSLIGLLAMLVIGLAVGAAYVRAQDQAPAKGVEKMVTGEAVDLFCYIAHGMTGEAQKGCADRTKKKVLPVGIVEEGTGQVYVAVFRYKRPAVNWPDAANDSLVPLLGKKVNANGSVFEKGGCKLIEIHTVAEAL